MSKEIYIKDVEWPECCYDEKNICFAYDGVECHCRLRPKEMVHFSTRVLGKKPLWCPIAEVPEHGDLIDKDAYEFPGDLIYEPIIIPKSKTL